MTLGYKNFETKIRTDCQKIHQAILSKEIVKNFVKIFVKNGQKMVFLKLSRVASSPVKKRANGLLLNYNVYQSFRLSLW